MTAPHKNLPRYWVAVVSANHVAVGMAEGFCQACHGKAAPLKRMEQGDYLLYYSPKTDLHGGEKLQAFTAAGKMIDERVYQFEMSPDFIPYRRDVFYYRPVKPCPIEYARLHPEWKGYASQLRYGFFEVSKDFYLYIFNEMKQA